jgi:hypothetical protein
MNYYFITCFSSYDTYGIHTARTWGFFDNYKDADAVVRNNVTDLWETVYDYAVIEEYKTGIGGYTFERWFYAYNIETNQYEPIDEPELLRHWCGFALG